MPTGDTITRAGGVHQHAQTRCGEWRRASAHSRRVRGTLRSGRCGSGGRLGSTRAVREPPLSITPKAQACGAGNPSTPREALITAVPAPGRATRGGCALQALRLAAVGPMAACPRAPSLPTRQACPSTRAGAWRVPGSARRARGGAWPAGAGREERGQLLARAPLLRSHHRHRRGAGGGAAMEKALPARRVRRRARGGRAGRASDAACAESRRSRVPGPGAVFFLIGLRQPGGHAVAPARDIIPPEGQKPPRDVFPGPKNASQRPLNRLPMCSLLPALECRVLNYATTAP